MTGLGTVQARMVGGPVAKQYGEVVSPPPQWLYFGAQGGFCYRLDPHANPRKAGKRVAVYKYDRQATHEKLLLLGMPIDLARLATTDDTEAMLQAAYEDGMRDRPEIAGREVGVRIELWADEWQVHVAGELVHTVPRASIDPEDHDAIQALAEEIGREFIERTTEVDA